ncbi:hypothetical protein CJ030_MR4G010934 [Morella rubra]|uniref:Uncharacterized protein n=1 Tax=Morella rubra TaxID=262757 RepID=A0A6A1VSA6_9ROSI|nr:hypothetical protein CJ030_MR4G010934 [Morella rubra]
MENLPDRGRDQEEKKTHLLHQRQSHFDPDSSDFQEFFEAQGWSNFISLKYDSFSYLVKQSYANFHFDMSETASWFVKGKELDLSVNGLRVVTLPPNSRNEDDEWVKKAVAKPSQEIHEEKAEEEEAKEEDPKKVEAMAEDRLVEDDILVPASPRTPHTLATGRSISSRSHATRLALLEASVSNLRDQLFSIHIDLWIGLEDIKSLLESHTTKFALSIREARLT